MMFGTMPLNASTTKESTGRVDLAVKLLAYAIDPAASDGEAQSGKFVSVARKSSITLDVLAAFSLEAVNRMRIGLPRL